MRLPTPRSMLKRGGTHAPAFFAALSGPTALFGPRSVPRALKVVLDVAYVLWGLVTAVLVLAFVAVIFIPMDNVNVTVTSSDGGRQQPLTRALMVFGVGGFLAYFVGFLLILGALRHIMRALSAGDPFHPANVNRLRRIGLILAVVTGGVWFAQRVVAARWAPGVIDSPGVGDLVTPIFSVLIVFVLAEVFREGARLRRDSELTI